MLGASLPPNRATSRNTFSGRNTGISKDSGSPTNSSIGRLGVQGDSPLNLKNLGQGSTMPGGQFPRNPNTNVSKMGVTSTSAPKPPTPPRMGGGGMRMGGAAFSLGGGGDFGKIY